MKMTLMPAGFRCLKNARHGLSKLTLYRHRGSIDCRRCQHEDFAGSEVSIFTLEKAYSAGVTPEQSQTLINQAALAEFMRGLGFVPLIATTALATGSMQLRALPLFMRWAISRRIRWLQRY